EHGQILVLSDHADAAADSAAGHALGNGFRVSALGLGTASGAPYRDGEGRILHARLDAGTLRALASAGGGAYQGLATDDSDLRALGVLDPGDAGASAQGGEKRLSWQDGGYWLLPPLMLLALFAFRRGGALAAVALCVCLPMAMPANAGENGMWMRADQQRHERIEQGAEAYRKGDFAAAEKEFSGIDSADAFYNQGNALAKQGRYDEAIAAYDQALKLQPKMEDAIENRKVVDAARKRKGAQDKQQQGKSDGKGKPQDNKGKPQDNKRKPQPGDQEKPQAQSGSQPPSSPKPDSAKQQTPSSENGQSPQQKANDAKAQQAADAAQRERMDQAMAQAGKEQQKNKSGTRGASVAKETPAQREHRQAVEAWLRRVPDEPGNLLKTKFRLEYERRQKEGR
ncbi:MAG: tetratricopeptide repeat protein, partial [Pseudoxanthomonas sp.]